MPGIVSWNKFLDKLEIKDNVQTVFHNSKIDLYMKLIDLKKYTNLIKHH